MRSLMIGVVIVGIMMSLFMIIDRFAGPGSYPVESIDESSSSWIPRIGNRGAPKRLGECGQIDTVRAGRTFMHRVECPR